MPVGLSLAVPAWDDVGDVGLADPAPAAKLGNKIAKHLPKQRANLLKLKSVDKLHGSSMPAGRADKEADDECHAAHRPSDQKKKKKTPSQQNDIQQLQVAEAPSVDVGTDSEGLAGARKRKRRKGKHSKNKAGDEGVAGKDKGRKSTAQLQTRDSATVSQSGRDETGALSESKRAKKRKRKNKFRESEQGKGEDDGDENRDMPATDAPDRKKQKLGTKAGGARPTGKGDHGDATAGPKPAHEAKKLGPTKSASPPEQLPKEATQDGGKQLEQEKFPFKDLGAAARNRRLTPLQAKLAAKLEAAHFRMLNEELYTTPSSAAVDMFRKEPSLFETYHQGFRRQTLKWPVNPVDVILKLLKKHPKWQIADLGCGDAKIAHSLPGGRVHSFDLVSVNSKVTACDIANVPLADDAVDAVVLSLALMGTNYAQFLKEANRIVKTGGRVLIAEVRSRCEHVLEDFLALLRSLGFKVDEVDKSNKMFIMFYLTKVGACGSISKLAAPELKACQYKKR